MSNQNLKTSNGLDKHMGISVIVKEPLVKKKPFGTGVSVIVKERRVLLNKDTYPELYAQWKRDGGRLPKCRRCKELIHFSEPAHVCEGFVPQYNDDVDWEQNEYDRQASLDEMRAEAREAPEDMDEDEICSEDDAEEYSE
jgi:hypothetical protein